MRKLMAFLLCGAISTQALAATGAQTLPPLPLPSGARIPTLGDSIYGYGDEVDTLGAGNLDKGEFRWAFAQDPRFSTDTWYDTNSTQQNNLSGADAGIFGDHLQATGSLLGIIPRLANVLAQNPDIVALEGGSNSINSGDGTNAVPSSAAYVIAQLDLGLHQILAARHWAILADILPRADWPIGDPRFATLSAVNAWIGQQANRPGVKLFLRHDSMMNADGTQNVFLFETEAQTTLSAAIDNVQTSIPVVSRGTFPQSGPFPIRVGNEEMLVTAGWGAGAGAFIVTRGYESTTSAAEVSGFAVGGGFIHPNRQGAYANSQILLPILRGMIASGSVFNQDSTVGNLYSSGPMTGSAGTNGTGSSGQVPTGFSVTVTRGTATVANAVSAIDGSHGKITLTISPPGYLGQTGANLTGFGQVTIAPSDVATGIPAAGSWLQFCGHVTIGNTTSIANSRGTLIEKYPSSATLTQSYSHNNFSPTFTLPGISNTNAWQCTNKNKIPAGITLFRIGTSIVFTFPNAATDQPVVTVDNWITRQVTDPTSSWHMPTTAQ